MIRILPAFLLALFVVTGCARSAGPLPGDSVSSDGGSITLSPPRLSTSPTESREAKEGLGPVESRLFPPELVMEHQADLGITPDQKKSIISETDRGQSEMVRLQWDLQAEKEKLVKLLDGDHLDEQKVQDIAKLVMEKESKVKASHLGMLVRVKNILTSEQIAKLREIRTGAITAAAGSGAGGVGGASTGAGGAAGMGGAGSGSSPSKPTPAPPSQPKPRSQPKSDPPSRTDVF